MKRRASSRRPLVDAFISGSKLLQHVREGLAAVKRGHKQAFLPAAGRSVAQSLNLDESLHSEHPQDPRWDYLLTQHLGMGVTALEVHAAKSSEVQNIIAKRHAARRQLAGHLKPGKCVQRWLWVAADKVHFAPNDQARRKLDQHGIAFIGRRICEGDLT